MLSTFLGGSSYLGGISSQSLAESELRSAACYFAEEAHLFSTTVRDNLLVARGDCTDEELLQTLEAVGLERWLTNLPDGLNTVLMPAR